MFARRFFPADYFAPRYFPGGGGLTPPTPPVNWDRTEIETDAPVETTDATLTTILTVPLSDNSIAHVGLIVAAFEPATGQQRMWRKVAAVQRLGGSRLIGDADEHTPLGDVGTGTWNVTLQISGNNLLIRATGEASKTIEWRAIADYRYLSLP